MIEALLILFSMALVAAVVIGAWRSERRYEKIVKTWRRDE